MDDIHQSAAVGGKAFGGGIGFFQLDSQVDILFAIFFCQLFQCICTAVIVVQSAVHIPNLNIRGFLLEILVDLGAVGVEQLVSSLGLFRAVLRHQGRNEHQGKAAENQNQAEKHREKIVFPAFRLAGEVQHLDAQQDDRQRRRDFQHQHPVKMRHEIIKEEKDTCRNQACTQCKAADAPDRAVLFRLIHRHFHRLPRFHRPTALRLPSSRGEVPGNSASGIPAS